MITSLVLFQQAYVREIVGRLRASMCDIEVRHLVASPEDARSVLRCEPVDVLIFGSTFIEDAPSLVASCVGPKRPMAVAVCRTLTASTIERARMNDIDFLVDMSTGLDAARLAIVSAHRDYIKGNHPSQKVFLSGGPHAEAIPVHDEIDQEIIEMIALGYCDRDIANAVCLSHQTVRNRISRILAESGLRNRTHLACTYLKILHRGNLPFVGGGLTGLGA